VNPSVECLGRERDRRCPVGFAGDVEVDVPRAVGVELGRHVRAMLVEHVAEHHPGALGHQVPHVRLAHPAGAAGDQRDPPV
jgi:hypothetical protein